MANTVKQISIATDSVNTYSTRDIGADAVNVDVSYDADGNVITDAETTVATKKSSAEAIKTINETLAADAEAINGKAPTSHASADTTYGLGTAENYGHVKLSDDYSSPTMGDDNDEAKYGIGASAFALKSVNQKLEQLRTDIKDLQITQGGSTGVTITRVPEIVLNPQFHKADSDGVYQFILQSALLKKEMPDTTKLILDFETEDISSETKAQITVNSYDGFDEDGLASYAETDYTLTANDIAYGYKYVASETTSTAEGEDGTETETTTQTYSYRVEILLRKQVNVTTGVYSLFFESVPNEKYLNNKCDEISAALDAANIPSDLGTTAGSAISALNTHLTENKDMICSVEEKTATAQYEHLAGAYFRYNDTLYVATTDISKGDTIVPNVNCRTTDVSYWLHSLTTQQSPSISISSQDHFSLVNGYVSAVGRYIDVEFTVRTLTEIDPNVNYYFSLGLPHANRSFNVCELQFVSGTLVPCQLWGDYDADLRFACTSTIPANMDLFFSFIYMTQDFL